MPQCGNVEFIECNKCKEWYHIDICVSVPQPALQKNHCHGCVRTVVYDFVTFDFVTLIIIILCSYTYIYCGIYNYYCYYYKIL